MIRPMPDYRTLTPDDFTIEDVARSLSKLCRYGGWLDEFYSVAEHCVVVSYLCPAHLQRAAMLHDAAECWLNDLHGPTKQRDEFAGYREVEAHIMRIVGDKFDVTESQFEEVKHWDSEAGKLERRQIYRNDRADNPLHYYDFKLAEVAYLMRWKEINK